MQNIFGQYLKKITPPKRTIIKHIFFAQIFAKKGGKNEQ
jgi:hypothetical protein